MNTTESRTRRKMGFCKYLCFPAGSFSSSWPGWLRTRRCQWSSCTGRWSGTREKGWVRGQREVFSWCCLHHHSFLVNIDFASRAAPVTVFSILLLLSNTSLLSINCLCVWKEHKHQKRQMWKHSTHLVHFYLFFTFFFYQLCATLSVHVRLTLLLPERLYTRNCSKVNMMLICKVEGQCKNVCPIIQKAATASWILFSSCLLDADGCCLDLTCQRSHVSQGAITWRGYC